MVDFCTGQLFDWFLSNSKAFTLIERLPTNVTNNVAACPGATPVGPPPRHIRRTERLVGVGAWTSRSYDLR